MVGHWYGCMLWPTSFLYPVVVNSWVCVAYAQICGISHMRRITYADRICGRHARYAGVCHMRRTCTFQVRLFVSHAILKYRRRDLAVWCIRAMSGDASCAKQSHARTNRVGMPHTFHAGAYAAYVICGRTYAAYVVCGDICAHMRRMSYAPIVFEPD